MSTIATIDAADLISDSRTDINTNFSNLNTDKIETSYLDTDTALAANSDVKIPSQKAVKTYIDTSGGANASETVRGIVEEATQAEVDAGTATGGTGARLFVNPSTAAETGVSKIIKTKSTGLLDTSIVPGYVSVPFFQQDLALTVNDSLTSIEFAAGSMTDGSAFFVYVQGTSLLYRFQRDTNTGQYYETHSIDPALGIPAGDNGAIVNIGIYIYLFTNDGTNIVCTRFLAADLTGAQVMTVPTVACTTILGAYTDGVSVYVTSATTDTTTRKWSLSGTTFSAVSTASSDNLEQNESSSMWDGTTAFIYRGALTTLYKLTNIDGSAKTTTTYKLPVYSDVQVGTFILNIDTTKIYLGFLYAFYDEAAQVSARIKIMPISKP